MDSRGPIQALHRPIKPFLRLRFWRIEGSNTAPYHFALEGIDSSPSLCNHGLKIGSYAPISYYTKVLKDSESVSKLPWADRLWLLINTPKIERDNEGKRRKRKNEGINRRIETLIIKAYEIGKFNSIDIVLTIYKYSQYIIYNSNIYILWPLSIIEIVNKVIIFLNIRVLIFYF